MTVEKNKTVQTHQCCVLVRLRWRGARRKRYRRRSASWCSSSGSLCTCGVQHLARDEAVKGEFHMWQFPLHPLRAVRYIPALLLRAASRPTGFCSPLFVVVSVIQRSAAIRMGQTNKPHPRPKTDHFTWGCCGNSRTIVCAFVFQWKLQPRKTPQRNSVR